VSSSNDEEGITESGVPHGAISGYLSRSQPGAVRRLYALPCEVCRIKDIELKYAVFCEAHAPWGADRGDHFIAEFDRALAKHNLEYEGKRSSRRLGPPALKLVRPGTYTALRQRRVAEGAPEAQVKIPHLSPDMNFGAEFEVIADHRLQVTAR
jgi:hypothetical protein